MLKIAITGHTQGLGKSLFDNLVARGHSVLGFSRSNGFDVRDYAKVTKIINQTRDFDWFINNAKPDFSQTQIVYRLHREQSVRNILSIGSAAVNNPPDWTDTYLLEYLTQKVALNHAHQVLVNTENTKLILVHPLHISDTPQTYVDHLLDSLKL